MINHRKAAAEAKARDAVATYGLPVDVSPAQALIEEVQRSAGAVAWLGAIVAGLERDDVVWGVVEQIERPGVDGEGTSVETKRRAAVNTWVKLYQEERRHLAAVSRDALGADAAGRVAAVFEQIGATYIALFERVMDRIGLTGEQQARVPVELQAQLEALVEGTSRP